MRRVKRLNPVAEQGELFTAFRYHAVFTDSPPPVLDAEAAHRQHAVVEQVIADLKGGPLAHLPSGKFTAHTAWRVLAAIAFNLPRTAGWQASAFPARATTATLRAQLIGGPARLARRLLLHLPHNWPWAHAWQQLAAAAPPAVGGLPPTSRRQGPTETTGEQPDRPATHSYPKTSHSRRSHGNASRFRDR